MSNLAAKRPLRPHIRFLAACVAALLLCTQFASVVHMVLVPHVTCPDHGELMHPGEDASSHSHGADPDGTEPHGIGRKAPEIQSARSAPDLDSAHGHDHCAVVAHRRENLALAAVSHGDQPAQTSAPALSQCATSLQIFGAPQSRALYLLAPKTSPPVST